MGNKSQNSGDKVLLEMMNIQELEVTLRPPGKAASAEEEDKEEERESQVL